MKIETNHHHIWLNGKMITLDDSQREGTTFSMEHPFEGAVVYEVIRVMEKKPLFLNEHMERMGESFETLSIQNSGNWSVVEKALRLAIDAVIQSNSLINNNIKLLIGNIEGDNWSGLVFPITSHYPSVEVYTLGVDTDVVNEIRHNPQVKVINEDLTEKIARLRQETGIFEALLCDSNDEIAEGSKSNVFFVKNGELVTPPAGAVLKGITRLKVMEAAYLAGIPVKEETVKRQSLETVEAAFLTGTSLHILPIKTIGSIALNSAQHPLVLKLMEAFEKLVEASK